MENTFLYMGLIALFFIMASVSINALSRYIINEPIQGIYETTEMYLMLMVIFLVAPVLQRNDGNIRVNILSKKFSKNVLIKIDIISQLITICILFVVFTGGLMRFYEALIKNWVTSAGIELPIYLSWAIFEIGILFLCMRLITQIIDNTKELVDI
jgi:TRAP-type C4-dicarboxylate transport system permease small subunit